MTWHKKGCECAGGCVETPQPGSGETTCDRVEVCLGTQRVLGQDEIDRVVGEFGNTFRRASARLRADLRRDQRKQEEVIK